jgi:hypothetical protein
VRLIVDQGEQVTARVPNLGPSDPRRARFNTVPKSQRLQSGDRISREDKAEPRLAKLGGALEHGRLDPSTLEGDRGRKSADTRADDNRPHAARKPRQPAQ